jgi:hypothetical protein
MSCLHQKKETSLHKWNRISSMLLISPFFKTRLKPRRCINFLICYKKECKEWKTPILKSIFLKI